MKLARQTVFMARATIGHKRRGKRCARHDERAAVLEWSIGVVDRSSSEGRYGDWAD